MLLHKQKKSGQAGKGNRLLISITVLGSAGPIRFVVYEGDLIAALKSYAREGRLPILGTDLNSFVLYCPVAGDEPLSPWETIGSLGLGSSEFHAVQEASGGGEGREVAGQSWDIEEGFWRQLEGVVTQIPQS